MIRLKKVSFTYGGRQVLDGLDFSLDHGERVGLAGPNGSGKTTLCHVIMGLRIPDSGEVQIFGKIRKTERDFEEVRSRIGFLFQDADDQLFCPTVVEDVAFGPLNQGKGREEAKAIAADTLSMLNLEGFEERITYQLSGGEKKLVALATILAMKPDMLILDEPGGGLDEETTELLAQILNKLRLTYLLVSHDRDFLKKTTDRVVTCSGGSLRESA